VKKIPTQFEDYGYVFKLLGRTKNIAIYEQSKKGEVYAYEVHIVRHPTKMREELPSASKFGTYGWSFYTLPAALKKAKELGG